MKIESNNYSLDSNVNIRTPKVNAIYSTVYHGWLIYIDDILVKENDIRPNVFKDISEATDYLISKDLVITKAYEEYSKRVRKSIKSNDKKEQQNAKDSARVGKYPGPRG